MVESMKRYHSNPLPLGIEVFGIDLSQPINNITKQQILEDVTKYRIVVFRNQVNLSFVQVKITNSL